MSLRTRITTLGIAVIAVLSCVPGVVSAAPFPFPPIPCGPITCDPTPEELPTVTYREVNFHFDSINVGHGCNGNGDIGLPSGFGWCDGVYTDGHIAPFDGRAVGTASWRGLMFTFSLDDGSGYIKGTIDDAASPVYTLTETSLIPSGTELYPRDRTSAVGSKGGPLHINIVNGSGIRKGLYYFYVHGWIGSFTRTVKAPSTGSPGAFPSGLFGSS